MKSTLKTISVLTGLCFVAITSKAQWTTSGTNIYNSNTGNVGIGTTTPSEKLQISGGSVLLDYWNGGPGGNLYFGGKTDNSQNGMRLSYYNNGGLGLIDVRASSLTTGLVFRVDNSIGGTERFRINANGNLGINNSSPTEKLDVIGNIRINNYKLYLRGGGDINHGLGWNAFGTGIDGSVLFGFNGGALGSTNGGNKIALRWDQNGSVLIGDPATVTLPTGYKLYVQTGILTERVKVAVATSTDWADYVFADNYKLKSISELEAFVKINKHLPNVPSAEQVVKEGVDMAKMDAKLLEKIEELALYIIELKKENTALLKRVEKIENK